MDERDEAPLDRLIAQLRFKWQETKEWLEDACTDDDNASSPACTKHASSLRHETSPAQQVENGQPIVSIPGDYEELGQTGSEPASAPQTFERLVTVPSSLPLPGKYRCIAPDQNAPLVSDVLSTAIPEISDQATSGFTVTDEHMGQHEGKLKTPIEASQNSDGPSAALLGNDMLRKGENVEVWSKSKQSWFEGLVLESFLVEGQEAGYRVPGGSYKVRYSENIIKWIKPEQVQELLRPASRISGI